MAEGFKLDDLAWNELACFVVVVVVGGGGDAANTGAGDVV